MLTSFAALASRKSFLKTIAVAAAAALLGACGSGSNSTSFPPPPPPPPPNPVPGVTYDVVPLVTDAAALIRVASTGINEYDMVTGIIFHPSGPSRAFLHNGTSLIDLGDFGGSSSQAFGINRCGRVAGWALGPVGDIPEAFRYDGALHRLGAPGLFSQSRAVNDCDKATGIASFGGANHAFMFDGVLHDLGTLGGARSEGLDINASGMVAGGSDFGATIHAFLYDSAGSPAMHDLGTLGGSRSYARALNDAGQVVGGSDNAAGKLHAYRYDGGAIHDLGTLGGDFSEAVEINAAGLVVGTATPPGGAIHGFMHDGALMHDIGTLGGDYSDAVAINADGVVVGTSTLPGAGGERAVAWTLAGGLVNLNDHLYAAEPGLRLTHALAINKKGSIVAVSNKGLMLLKVRQ